MIPCSNRIQKILSWVNGDVIADIGCDHAYVSVNAILNGQSKKAYACDIGLGPLKNAKKTIVDYHVKDKVIPCLLDGIQGLNKDVNQIIICGMGGKLIRDILIHGDLDKGVRLLLSCHKDEHALRSYLRENKIHIVKERMIHDGNHFYPLMDCIVEDTMQNLDEAELYFGKNMIINQEYKDYLDYVEDKCLKILEHVQKEECLKKIGFIKEIRIQRIS